jgi:tRNA C32,U32 (ribose-2'-O)-methylase TrmJ
LVKIIKEDNFIKGFAAACAITLRNHDCFTEIKETYLCNFMTISQLKAAGVDKYDIDILRPIIKEIKEQYKRKSIGKER